MASFKLDTWCTVTKLTETSVDILKKEDLVTEEALQLLTPTGLEKLGLSIGQNSTGFWARLGNLRWKRSNFLQKNSIMCPCKISVFRKIILSQTSSLSPRWNVLRLKILSIQYLTRKPQELTKYHLASSKRVCRLWSLVLPLLLTLLLEAEFSQLLGKLLKSDQFLRTEIVKKPVVMTNFATANTF